MARVYLDSCIIIYLVQGQDAERDAVLRALRPPDGEAPQVFVSALARLECRVWPLREGATELLAAFDAFFASRDLRRVRLTSAIFDLATEMRARYGVKTPDALHLAAAIEAECDELWTNDGRFRAAAREGIHIRKLP